VVDALERIHSALTDDGLVVDTQPVSARPPVESEVDTLGTLDMTEWAQLIDEIDARIAETFAAGLFAVDAESSLIVTDEYDDGDEFLSYASNWVGTRIEPELQRRAALERGRVRIHQEIRMRLLGARAGP
jgi:hypothetical protein